MVHEEVASNSKFTFSQPIDFPLAFNELGGRRGGLSLSHSLTLSLVNAVVDTGHLVECE